jgi:hypothetical protein
VTKEWCDVRLPAELCIAVEQQFGQKFGSLEQFLELVLRELVASDAVILDRTERRIIEQRLRDLGYI